MFRSCVSACVVALWSVGAASGAGGAFATGVMSYEPGANVPGVYQNPAVAIGSPERFTGEGVFPTAVTPFNPPFGVDEIVGVGQGGHLTLSFDKPVRNDPLNPYGIDLLVFTNIFFAGDENDVAVGQFGSLAGAVIEVSNGGGWVPVPGVGALPVFPTLGYLDVAGPTVFEPGNVLSDFTVPVDPAFDPIGRTFAEIVAAYGRSGGGVGIDLAGTGLSEITMIRFSSTGGTYYIDAVAAVTPVPAPGGAAMLGLVGLSALRRRR
ncbi:MAG: hypothetical protein KF859_14280 [Phycisphaeraceae bacterium]|nr:hypothetical protein [Phycisphaeraceae bacterium]